MNHDGGNNDEKDSCVRDLSYIHDGMVGGEMVRSLLECVDGDLGSLPLFLVPGGSLRTSESEWKM